MPQLRPYVGFVLLPFAVLIFSVIACTGVQTLGTLSAGDEPVTFTLLGEVSHSWRADVTAGRSYRIIIEKQDSEHPLHQHQISILVQLAVDSEISFIGTSEVYTQNLASVDFVAPDTGTTSIIVMSKIGENENNLGTFGIQLVKIDGAD